MTRSVQAWVRAAAMFFFAAVCILINTRAAPLQEVAMTIVGRLATVEPADRRITVLPEGEVSLIEIFVAEDGAVVQEDQAMTLSELVIQVGRRVTVHYRVDGSRRVAQRVIVDPA